MLPGACSLAYARKSITVLPSGPIFKIINGEIKPATTANLINIVNAICTPFFFIREVN